MGKPLADTDEKIKRLFAARLRSARIMAGYPTAKAIAEKLGMEHETYRRWERAETEPDIPKLAKLSALLNVSLDFLLLGVPQAVPQPKVGSR